MSAARGVPVSDIADWLGQPIEVGTHVIVLQVAGSSAAGWSGVVLDIAAFANPYSNEDEIKVRVQPTGLYSPGAWKHGWEQITDPLTNRRVWSGQRPRPSWIMSKNVLRAIAQEDPDLGDKVADWL